MEISRIYLDIISFNYFGCKYSELDIGDKIGMIHNEICVRTLDVRWQEKFDERINGHIQSFKNIEEACGVGWIGKRLFIKVKKSAWKIWWDLKKLNNV